LKNQFVLSDENPYHLLNQSAMSVGQSQKGGNRRWSSQQRQQARSPFMGVAFATMYLITGSFAFGGIAAVIEPICNVIIMPLHEKLWKRIRRRIDARRNGGEGIAPNGTPQAV
jgi:uncharacterized membrane protein